MYSICIYFVWLNVNLSDSCITCIRDIRYKNKLRLQKLRKKKLCLIPYIRSERELLL